MRCSHVLNPVENGSGHKYGAVQECDLRSVFDDKYMKHHKGVTLMSVVDRQSTERNNRDG